MRPHEETWELDANDPESGPVIGLKDGGVLFECNDKPRATLAHAAPDMARALRGLLLFHGHTDGCPGRLGFGSPCYTHCENARAALKKAGVAP